MFAFLSQPAKRARQSAEPDWVPNQIARASVGKSRSAVLGAETFHTCSPKCGVGAIRLFHFIV